MKRIISLVLAVILAASMPAIASGCGKNESVSTDVLQGKTIRIGSWGSVANPTPGTEDGDLIIEQITAAEEKYGCKLEYITNSDIFTQIMTAASTGQAVAEVIAAKTHRVRELLRKGDYYWSLEELGVEPEQEHFNKDSQFYSEYEGKTYGWWYQPTTVNNVLVINKSILDREGIDMPYDLVADNKWTFEEWHKLMMEASNPDKGILGVTRIQAFTTVAMWANDTSVYRYGDDGIYYENTSDAKLSEILQLLSDWTVNDKIIDFAIGTAWDQAQKDFLNGSYVSIPAGLSYMRTTLADKNQMSDEWGIMPIPIGPSATEYKKLDIECKAFAIQKAVPLEEAKALFEFIDEAFAYPLDEEEGMRAKYQAFCPDKESLDNMLLVQALPLTLMSEWTEPDVRTYDSSIMSDLNGMAAGEKPIRSTLDSMAPKVQATLDEHYGQKIDVK